MKHRLLLALSLVALAGFAFGSTPTNLYPPSVMDQVPAKELPTGKLDNSGRDLYKPRLVIDRAGGPDGFGYVYKDETEPGGPTFSWIDTIGATNTGITGDDSYGTVSLPFTFYYYGTGYTTIYPCTNGWAGLSGPGSSYYNYPLPSTSLPAAAICAYWDDLYVDGGTTGNIFYKTVGTAPNRKFAIIWQNVRLLGGSTYMDFEIVLSEADSSITLQYSDLAGNTGSGATVGIQGATSGSNYLQYSYNEGALINSRAIRFWKAPSVSTDAGIWAILSPGASVGMRGASIAPACSIKNFGTSSISNIPVRCTIFGTGGAVRYTGNQTVAGPLAPNATAYVNFTGWNPTIAETVLTVFRTALSGDQNPDNDRRSTQTVLHPAYMTGGPDANWWFWIDSDTTGGPTYSWIDTSGATATSITGDDNRGAVPLPFSFSFEGSTYDTIWVCTNGWFSFGPDPGVNSYYNYDIPNTGLPNNYVGVLWDDLYVDGSTGRIYTKVVGTAPNRQFVIIWNNVRELGSTDWGSWEAILDERDGTITLQYADVDFGSSSYNNGISATVGIENATGTDGLRYLYGDGTNALPSLGNLLAAGRAIKFYRNAPANDVGVRQIVNPTGFWANQSFTPAVLVRNGGSVPQSNIPVYITIDSAGTTVYSANTTIPGPLAPESSVVVSFTNPFTVGNKGTYYALTSWTALSGDQFPANDTSRLVGYATGAPNRYMKFMWGMPLPSIYSVGCTPVNDTTIWVSAGSGGSGRAKIYIVNTNTLSVVDSFYQGGLTSGGWGAIDMCYDPTDGRVYAGNYLQTRNYVYDAATRAVVDSFTTPSFPGLSYLNAIAVDGDSLYSNYWSYSGIVKFSKRGTGPRQVQPNSHSGIGLAYSRTGGILYLSNSTGTVYPDTLFQFDDLSWALLHDTLPPGTMGLGGGCETWRGDSFLVMVIQGASTDSLLCWRIIPKPVDYGAVAVVSPTGNVDTNGVVIPAARWRNFHPTTADRFRAWYFLTNPSGVRVHSQSLTVDGLMPGRDTVLYFLPYNVGMDTGVWSVKCSTFIDGDLNPANDVITATFTVRIGPPPPGGWSEITQVPLTPSGKAVKDGGAIAFDAGLGVHFVLKGNKTGDFYAFDGTSWTTLPTMPPGTEAKLPNKGANICTDGNGVVYATKGNNTAGFWKYAAAESAWTQLTDVPLGASNKKVKGGTDLVYVDDGESTWVYLLKGYKTEFYRYNTVSGAWYTLSDAPAGQKAKYDKGSWLVYDAAGRRLYAHKAKYSEMYAYSLDSLSWGAQLAGIPLQNTQTGKSKKAKDGSDGAIMGGWLYALKGGNTCDFYAYDLTAGTWAEKETMPSVGSTQKKKRVKGGGSLTTDGSYLYALKGNKTVELWRYSLGGVYAGQPARSGVLAGTTVRPAGITLGPNPLSAGTALLRWSLPVAGPATVRVYDVTGRSVLSRSLVAGTSGSVALDLRNLSAGVYLVKLEATGFTGSTKLVIER